ncbi:MAG: tetratricopeptide repeat protein [Methanotrichaceae archaeon]|nr:tetratricopeptide repeat protein [Methanotrichaceae archaeon]
MLRQLFLWLCIIFLTGFAGAEDIPFVSDNKTSDIANYTAVQLGKISSSSSYLKGIPLAKTPSNNEVLEFPVTGGGNNSASTLRKKVDEINKTLNEKVEPNNAVIRGLALSLAAKCPGDQTIDQICEIYSFLKYGNASLKGWSYVTDPRGIDYFNSASNSVMAGSDAGRVGAGDCDDFAVLMASMIESIGGATRIFLVKNSTRGGHAFTEVYLGPQNSQTNTVINWLKKKYNANNIFFHINTSTKEVWLNLDWGIDEKGNAHPGGPFYQGEEHYILRMRNNYGKKPVTLPEQPNKPPKLINLIPDKLSPQNAGTVIAWTATAKDLENDSLQYRFFLNSDEGTNWQANNKWNWITTEYDVGDNKVEACVRDGKHAGPDRCDSNKPANFVITLAPSEPEQIKTNNPPSISSLKPDKQTPQSLGTVVTWTAEARDPDNDQILYRFFLNGQPATIWTRDNLRAWDTTEANVGDNQIEVWIRDGKHANQESYDDRKSASFTITASNQKTVIGELEISDPSILTDRGNDLFESGSYEEALKYYERAIQHSPSYADAWYGKANVLGQQGKFEESLACLDKCIEIDPSNLAALNNKGAALVELRRYDEALACYDKSIDEDPTYAIPWSNKAEVLLKLGNFEEALDCSEEYLSIDSTSAFAWTVKGKAFANLGKYNDALDCFSKALELDSQDTDAWNSKGSALEKLSRNSEAEIAYQKARELGYNG